MLFRQTADVKWPVVRQLLNRCVEVFAERVFQAVMPILEAVPDLFVRLTDHLGIEPQDPITDALDPIGAAWDEGPRDDAGFVRIKSFGVSFNKGFHYSVTSV